MWLMTKCVLHASQVGEIADGYNKHCTVKTKQSLHCGDLHYLVFYSVHNEDTTDELEEFHSVALSVIHLQGILMAYLLLFWITSNNQCVHIKNLFEVCNGTLML